MEFLYFIYLYLQTFSNICCRFINDIFLLWNGYETQLLDYIKRLNSRYPKIKFDFHYSKFSIVFLDTKIYKNKEKSTLLTKIYQKPTNRGNFLDPTQHCWYCWLLAYHLAKHPGRKISAEKHQSLTNIELKESFINHDYKENFITNQFNRISEVTREALLTSKPKLAKKKQESHYYWNSKELYQTLRKPLRNTGIYCRSTLLWKILFKRDQ